jgi:hypothetical protein
MEKLDAKNSVPSSPYFVFSLLSNLIFVAICSVQDYPLVAQHISVPAQSIGFDSCCVAPMVNGSELLP